MSRRTCLLATVTALVCVLFASVSTSGGVDLWGPPEWNPTPRDRGSIELEIVAVDSEPVEAPGDDASEPFTVPPWLVAVLRVIAVGLAAAFAVALALLAWRNRPRVRWRRRDVNDDFEVLPDVAAAVVGMAATQRAALLDGAPRNAIVQCWLQLERDVAAAGLRRDPADTSLEFTERVLGRYTVDSGAIEDLAARYREARFSDHRLDETDRDAALAALDRLHRSLDAQVGAET